MVSKLKEDDNISRSFEELVKLSTLPGALFKIVGNHNEFIIKTSSNNIVIGICLLLSINIPLLLVFLTNGHLFSWIGLLLVIIAFFVFLRYYPTTNNLIVDRRKRKITIKSNNFIGKYIISTTEVNFGDVQSFETKRVSVGQTVKSYYNKIYIAYANRKVPLIELQDGPFHIISHTTFINSLEEIIGKKS